MMNVQIAVGHNSQEIFNLEKNQAECVACHALSLVQFSWVEEASINTYVSDILF